MKRIIVKNQRLQTFLDGITNRQAWVINIIAWAIVFALAVLAYRL